MNDKKINYYNRNFAETRGDLINLIKQYYPSLISDFNDASIASVFIDLNSATTDLLSHHTDRMFQETQLEYAQMRNSILSMAKTMGLKISGKRPSITVCDFSVTIPTSGSSYDATYMPIIKAGTQVSGNGKVFELLEDIDFSNPFASGGIPNRLIIPNIDSSGSVLNYTITKRDIVQNGVSKIFKRVIGIESAKPFFTITLPDTNILNIDSIIVKEGSNYTQNPLNSEFYSEDNRWHEVDSLSESVLFKEQPQIESDDTSIRVGKWSEVRKRFITEYTGKGFLQITFGGGDFDISNIFEINNDNNPNNDILIDRIGNIINNQSLGQTLPANSTIFIKYKIGGGSESNIGSGVLNKVMFVDMVVNGSDANINSSVVSSLKVNNPIPALGGRSEPSISEIRELIKYNYASQNRAVTLKDYHALIGRMGGKFGAPYRYGVMEEQNKIVVNVLSKNENNVLTSNLSSALTRNITEYLSEYKMLNDYIQVKSGKIINIGVDVDVMVENNVSKSVVVSTIIKSITDYFKTDNFQMGDNIYLSNLMEVINNINGVLNVIDMKIINKNGDGYSNTLSMQSVEIDDQWYIDFEDNYTLYSEINSLFEIKYPSKDIRCRIK